MFKRPNRRRWRPRSYAAVEGRADLFEGSTEWDGPQVQYGRLSGWLIDARTRAAAAHISGKNVLDAGCNIADLAHVLSKEIHYLGLERVPEIVDLAKKIHPTREFMICDLEGDWPAELEVRRFDHIALLAVVEHLKDPEAVIRRAAGLLEPDGTIILTTPHVRAAHVHAVGARVGLFSQDADEEHERFFDRRSLAELAEAAGLKLIEYQRFQLGLNQLAIFGAER